MSIEPLNSDAEPSPFHRGDQAIQAKLGVRERSEKIGAIAIRDHLPEVLFSASVCIHRRARSTSITVGVCIVWTPGVHARA